LRQSSKAATTSRPTSTAPKLARRRDSCADSAFGAQGHARRPRNARTAPTPTRPQRPAAPSLRTARRADRSVPASRPRRSRGRSGSRLPQSPHRSGPYFRQRAAGLPKRLCGTASRKAEAPRRRSPPIDRRQSQRASIRARQPTRLRGDRCGGPVHPVVSFEQFGLQRGGDRSRGRSRERDSPSNSLSASAIKAARRRDAGNPQAEPPVDSRPP
jgi:hypothetical protein